MWSRVLAIAAILLCAKAARADQCVPAKPSSKDPAAQISMSAQAHLARHQWEDAAAGFRDLAFHHLDFASAMKAPQLYLQSINELALKGRNACYDKMAEDVPRLVTLYCDGDGAEKNRESCELLDKVGADIDRLAAQNDVHAADMTTGESARALYEQGGKKYLALFQGRCNEPVMNGREPRIEHCDEIAYNAARAFAGGRFLAKSISAYRGLISFDERWKTRSPLAIRATQDLARSYEAIGVFDLAAEWHEKLARSFPTTHEADDGLVRAVTLRLGTGNVDEAIRDASLFVKTYGSKDPRKTLDVVLAIATSHIEHERWKDAHTTLAGFMSVADRANLDQRARMHVLLGRVAVHTAPPLAKQEYERTKALFLSPRAMSAIFAEFPLEADYQSKHVLAALDAHGEATFALAEEKRRTTFAALGRPVDPRKKRAAIEELEAAYAEVLKIEGVPKWSVAAQRQIAFMWADLATDVSPLKREKAKPAMLECLALAKKQKQGGEDVRACEAWLAKYFPREVHVLDELVPYFTSAPIASSGAPVAAR